MIQEPNPESKILNNNKEEFHKLITDFLQTKKIKSLDLYKSPSYFASDIYLVKSISPRQGSAIGRELSIKLKEENFIIANPMDNKGKYSPWVVMDLFQQDCAIHVFTEQIEEQYQIKKLITEDHEARLIKSFDI